MEVAVCEDLNARGVRNPGLSDALAATDTIGFVSMRESQQKLMTC